MTDQEFEKFAKEQELNSIGYPYEIRQVCEAYHKQIMEQSNKHTEPFKTAFNPLPDNPEKD